MLQMFREPKFYVLLCFLVLAAWLRLIWPGDMEYKGDEFHIYEAVKRFVQTGEIQRHGIQASINIPNPGMSVWPFMALGRAFQVSDPVDLSLAVRWLNIFAFGYFIFFVFRVVPQTFRDVWFWAFLLAAVNPFMVIWQRKIWPPSIFPIFSLLLLTGYFKRSEWWGAMLLGFFAVLVGQIQLAAFFFTIPLLVYTLVFHFRADERAFKWPFCLLGCLLGLVPAWPWLTEVVANYQASASNSTPAYIELVKLRFWRYWFTEPFAVKLTYSLGNLHFKEFLASPIFAEKRQYLVAGLHGMLYGMLAFVYFGAVRYLYQKRPSIRSIALGSNENQMLFAAAFWGFGIFLSVTTFNALIYRHYLMILFPLTFAFVAFVILRTQKHAAFFLGLLVALNFLISVAFLQFIHVHGGTSDPAADYGTVYRLQNLPQKAHK